MNGIQCPNCNQDVDSGETQGSHKSTRRTTKRRGWIRRERTCTHCGWKMVTEERIVKSFESFARSNASRIIDTVNIGTLARNQSQVPTESKSNV